MQDQLRLSKYRFGFILSIIICVLPLLLWLEAHHISDFTDTPGGLYALMAKSSSLVGTAMFAWSLILSARPRFIESLFNGLDKMYKIHRYFGTISLGLLLLHPLFLTFKYNARNPGSARHLWFSTNLAINLGIVSLVAMLGIIIATVFARKMKHETFIAWHRTLGAIFLVGAAHSLMVKGEIVHNPALRVYMIGLLAFAAICYLYFTVFGQLLVKRYRYTIYFAEQIGPGVTEIRLKRASPLGMIFTPGQFAYLSFKNAPIAAEPHPFSIASGNRDSNIRFVVKALGDYTTTLPQLKPGLQALVEGPYGRFSYLNVKSRRQIWIAGGIGITPFLSMARSLPFKRFRIDLIYTSKTRADAVFAEEFEMLAKVRPGFSFHLWLESENSFIHATDCMKLCPETDGADFLICGPPVMMKSMEKQLLDMHIPAGSIHFEEFSM